LCTASISAEKENTNLTVFIHKCQNSRSCGRFRLIHPLSTFAKLERKSGFKNFVLVSKTFVIIVPKRTFLIKAKILYMHFIYNEVSRTVAEFSVIRRDFAKYHFFFNYCDIARELILSKVYRKKKIYSQSTG